MPRTTREWAHRELDAAYNNLDWAGQHCGRVAQEYETLHPEISTPIDDVLELIVQTQKVIMLVRGHI